MNVLDRFAVLNGEIVIVTCCVFVSVAMKIMINDVCIFMKFAM